MNWLGLLSFSAARDPELAPHAYLMYLQLLLICKQIIIMKIPYLVNKQEN